MGQAPEKHLFSIPGPAGPLEALLETPPHAADVCMAVLCHPHPQFGGTMHNKVVHTLARAMNDLGVPALRFNFRGVGASAGSYAEGRGEIDDVGAIVDYVRQHWPGADIWMAGFSFGAVVAARAAIALRPARLISIAPAVTLPGQELPGQPLMPWLIIQGEADEVVPPNEVRTWVDQLQPRPELIMLHGAGHFFHGHLVELRKVLVASLSN